MVDSLSPPPASGKYPVFSAMATETVELLGSIFVEKDAWEGGADLVKGYTSNGTCANCGDSESYRRLQLGAADGPYMVSCCDGSMSFDAYRVVVL